ALRFEAWPWRHHFDVPARSSPRATRTRPLQLFRKAAAARESPKPGSRTREAFLCRLLALVTFPLATADACDTAPPRKARRPVVLRSTQRGPRIPSPPSE